MVGKLGVLLLGHGHKGDRRSHARQVNHDGDIAKQHSGRKRPVRGRRLRRGRDVGGRIRRVQVGAGNKRPRWQPVLRLNDGFVKVMPPLVGGDVSFGQWPPESAVSKS